MAAWIKADLFLIMIICVLLGAGCSQNIPAPAPAGSENSAVADPPAGRRQPAGFMPDPVEKAPDFTLTDQAGRPFTLSEQPRRVFAIFFGYTHCPDVCPLTMNLLNQAYAQLGDAAKDVRVLFVTTDPERDTPERLTEFLQNWPMAATGLTGKIDELAAVWSSYGVDVAHTASPDGEHGIMHSNQVWLVDRAGDLRLFHLLGTSAEALTNDLLWLAEEGDGA